MDISKVIPDRFVRYQWQQPDSGPYNPATAVRFPLSRRAWFSVGHAGGVIPTGAQVVAVPVQPDGTRGILSIWADWFQGIGGTNNFIQVALLDGNGPDALPPTFVRNATNTRAGRFYHMTITGQTTGTVASGIRDDIEASLTVAGLNAKFQKLGGELLSNVLRADLGTGTMVIVSPAPWRTSQLQSLTGVWGNMIPGSFEEHQGTYRPEFLAGCRPAPWLVVGNPWLGRGEQQSPIG